MKIVHDRAVGHPDLPRPVLLRVGFGAVAAGLLGLVPGLRLAAPRDQERLVEALRQAIDVDDAATAGGHRSMSELIADTEPAPEAALIAAGDSDWQTTPVPEIGASVTLDTGAQL